MQKTILIVDDSSTARKQLSMLLEQLPQNFKIVEAENGMDALRILPTLERCDMIITDLNMPRLTGLELIQTLKADSNFSSIPCVLLTTVGSDPAKIVEAKEAGALGWIQKPLNAEFAKQLIFKVLGDAA